MINRRLAVLIDKDEKTDQQLKEMDKLIDHHVKLLKAHADAKAKAERHLSQGSSPKSEGGSAQSGGNGKRQ